MSEQASQRCQRPIEAGQARCACGCALPNNNLAVTHSGRRRPLTLAEARQSPDFKAWLEDRGGEQNIPAPVMAPLVRAVGTDMVAKTAINDLREAGRFVDRDAGAEGAPHVFHGTRSPASPVNDHRTRAHPAQHPRLDELLGSS